MGEKGKAIQLCLLYGYWSSLIIARSLSSDEFALFQDEGMNMIATEPMHV